MTINAIRQNQNPPTHRGQFTVIQLTVNSDREKYPTKKPIGYFGSFIKQSTCQYHLDLRHIEINNPFENVNRCEEVIRAHELRLIRLDSVGYFHGVWLAFTSSRSQYSHKLSHLPGQKWPGLEVPEGPDPFLGQSDLESVSNDLEESY